MSAGWDYLQWNNALGKHFFNPSRAYQDVYLATDSSVLSMVSGLTALEAEQSFLTAIRQVCSQKTGWERAGLHFYKTNPLEWRPFCIGLLCFQVFIAFQMEEVEDEHTAHNYWGVMNKYLGNGVKSTYPGNLTGALHQTLWRECLERWANSPQYHEQGLGRLVLPDPNAPGHRHIALPLSQALLRREDCLRLHNFFYAADLRPGDELEAETLYQLILSTAFQPPLHNHAKKVFRDELRREHALGQVLDELYEWDGSTSDRAKRSVYKMWLRFNPRKPAKNFSGIARVTHDTLEDEIPSSLSSLLQNQLVLDGTPYTLSSFRSELRVLVMNDSLGCYLEQRYLGPEQVAAVLARGEFAQGLMRKLREAGIAFTEFPEVELPYGWKFIWLEAPVHLPVLPDWLNIFEPRKISIRPSGGAKLRPGVWMAGAGPTLRVLGDPVPDFAWIQGHKVDIKEGILWHPCLNEPGEHVVVIPRRGINSYIHVEEPTLLATCWPPVWERVKGGWPQSADEPGDDADQLVGFQVNGEWPGLQPEIK